MTLPPINPIGKIKSFFDTLNGWGKVLVVAFCCGVLYAKVDSMDKKLNEIIEDHKDFNRQHSARDVIIAVQGQRITALEKEVEPLKEKK